MAIGLEKPELVSAFLAAVEQGRKNYLAGGSLDGQQAEHIAFAVAETVAQNNARVLEALTNAGVKL